MTEFSCLVRLIPMLCYRCDISEFVLLVLRIRWPQIMLGLLTQVELDSRCFFSLREDGVEETHLDFSQIMYAFGILNKFVK